MPVIARNDDWIIKSDFGSSIHEGSLINQDNGPGRTLTFQIQQIDRKIDSVWIEITNLTTGDSDFWNAESNVIGGAPGLSFFPFVSTDGGTVSIVLNSDSYQEGNETFRISVHDGVPAFNPALISANITIVDDDINGTSKNDSLVGSRFDDFMRGFSGNDTLMGDAGNDTCMAETAMINYMA